MADFPDAIYDPRTMVNRPGVTYDETQTKRIYAEDFNLDRGEIVAIETEFAIPGWRPLTTIPTLQSSDDPVYVLRFGVDMTAKLQAGHRIRLTQNGTIKYFIVVAVGAYTGGNTDVTVYGGTDYDMENTATYPVTLPKYSSEKCPFGFPANPTKWTITVTDTSDRLQNNPVQNTWYNLGSVSISIPIGCWRVLYEVVATTTVTTGDTDAAVSFSTSNNSVSDSDFSTRIYSPGRVIQALFTKEKILLLAAKTTYYLIERTTRASMAELKIEGSTCKITRISLICAYL